ncbi:MAG: VanW family protein [Clostridiales bacterium]|nr:VanW family protein [Clostridiales bacterium]
MKKYALKFICTFTALVLWASAVFFCCGFSVRLPRGVFVDGIAVGGLTRAEAKNLLRRGVEEELKTKRLHICADERVFTYAFPEIDYADNLDEMLPKITRGGDYFSRVTYRLNGKKEVIDGIYSALYRAPVEPYATFNAEGDPFTYYKGSDGVECDKERLSAAIDKSLEGGFEDVRICTRVLKRQLCDEDIRARTRKLYSFTTYFDESNTDRSGNIRLAAQKINGKMIESGGVFSFNATVGARTEESGFKPAKIIEDGKFVLGYGGGVCQVSTTLYNAALLSGLEIVEYHPHSLQVGYVAPSRDAMVSGSYFDLKFKNTRLTPVYVRVNCGLGSITCTVYGESDGYKYSLKSAVTGTVPRPQTVIVEGDEDKILTYGRDGTESEGYLIKSGFGGETCTLIRKDSYRAVADVVQKSGNNS